MRRGVASWLLAVLVVGGVGALYGWKGGRSLFFLLLLLLLVMLQGACAQWFGPRRVTVKRSWLPHQPRAGDTIQVKLDITISGGWLPMWLVAEDKWSASANTRQDAGPLGGKLVFGGWGKKYSGIYNLNETHRGIYEGGSMTLTWGDSFGWFKRSLRAETSDVLVIHPAPLAVPPAGAEVREHCPEGDGSGRDAVLQGSPDSGRLRTYEPGDPLRSIHWKSSAKKGTLLTRVPEARESLFRCLVLDTAHASYPGDGRPAENSAGRLKGPAGGGFEIAVRAAASWLARELERSGDVIFRHGGMRGPASPHACTLSGPTGLKAGLDMLAEIAPAANGTAAGVLRSALESVSDRTLTFITGSLTRELTETAVHFAERGAALEIWLACGTADHPDTARCAAILRQHGLRLVELASYANGKQQRSSLKGGPRDVTA